ncbi:MAG: NAD(P)/FAD-dependent oxidoreductase [Paenibacillaceae bacterium]|nr:NAD(P)/FAD-dependent oxidoreductase [Paenibacillaceae bacterium]
MPTTLHDVVVIGGGIVGTAILRELSQYKLDLCLVEKQPDVCEGTSKANSGIVHTGFDAPPGSIEAECLRRAQRLWPELVAALKIPFLSCGAVMVACSDEEKAIIHDVYIPNAAANGVDVRWIGKEELLERNPAVTSAAIGGLLIEGESIVDPFWATRSFAELAVLNGADVRLGNGVASIGTGSQEEGLAIVLEDGQVIRTRYAVNAAGLWSDEIGRMIGDDSFWITPRKGQFLLTEEPIAVSTIILPVPTKVTKGILLTPVVFGGFMLGPTAEDQDDKWDRSTTGEGMRQIAAGVDKLLPGVSACASIRQFAGVRAVCSAGDYVIRASTADSRVIHAAGIRSTGVSASPGIAEMVAERLEQAGLPLRRKAEARSELPELFDDEAQDAGEIVCLCRSITRGEVERVKRSSLPCSTIDGVKRRTGATLGECQGNYCIPQLLDVLGERGTASSHEPLRPLKGLRQSYFASVGKEEEERT